LFACPMYTCSSYLLFSIHYYILISFLIILPSPRSTLFPYTTLFRSNNPFIIKLIEPYLIFYNYAFPPFYSELTLCKPLLQTLTRSEEHTSELQSRFDLVCRLLLEKKNKIMILLKYTRYNLFKYKRLE